MQRPAGGAAIYWVGDIDGNIGTLSGTNSNWSTVVGGGTDYGARPANGDSLNFNAVGTTRYNVVNDIANLQVAGLTFLPPSGSFGASMTLSGQKIILSGGLTNRNTQSDRILTLALPIELAGNQTWSSGNDTYNGVTVVSGALTGTGTLTFATKATDGVNRSPFRLSGTNNGFTGNILFAAGPDAQTKGGLELLTPQAMISGNIDLNGGDYNLAIPSGPTFDFGIGTGARSVNFRDVGTGGLYLIGGGAAFWDPGKGGDYTWANSGTNQVRLNGNKGAANDYSPLVFGSSTGRLVLAGGVQSFTNGGGGNNATAFVTHVQFALSDDGTARVLETGTHMALTRPAVNTTIGTGGTLPDSRITVRSFSLSVTAMNQLLPGNLNLNGGTLTLDNLTWADFVAGRANGYSSNANLEGTWQISSGGGGFAARGQRLVIQGSGTDGTTFDRDFTLGSNARDEDGTFYANQGVDLAAGILMGSNGATRVISLAHMGPGLGNPANISVIQTISGNITDRFTLNGSGAQGALRIGSGPGPAGPDAVGELLLTGVNGWAGSATINNSNNASLSTGPGGLAIGGSGNVASGYVRFGSSAALPTHAGSNIGYYMVSSRNALNGFGGFLFTGTGGGSTYAIPGNTQFLFSGNANGTVGSQPAAAVLGVASGNAQADHATRATVQNAVVNLLTDNQNNTIAGATASLILLARDGTLRLDNVHFRAVRPDSTGLTVTPGAAYSPLTLPGGATALLDHTGLRTLYKRGEGTVELAAALYEDGGGTTVAVPSARYAWVLGRANGTDNTIAAPYFDGAIRETGSSTENSLTGFSVTFQGAVLESANSLLGGGFTRALGTATNQVRWAQGGGGFSAADGPLRVNIGGTSATLAWGGANFVPANNPLLFGSRTTRGAVTFENGLDLLNTNNSGSVVREIRVYDNQSSAADFAAITGPITQTGTGTSAGGLSVGGDGRLDLNGSLTYAGTTAVASGRLNINGTLSTGSAAVTIAAGATLGGTGVIGRPVTVSGQLDPGITTGTLGFG